MDIFEEKIGCLMEVYILVEKDADGDLTSEVFTTRDKAKEFGNRLTPINPDYDGTNEYYDSNDIVEWSDGGSYSFRNINDTVQEIHLVTLDPPLRFY